MIKVISKLIQIQLILRVSFCTEHANTRDLRHGFEKIPDYSQKGANWAETMLGSNLCDTGKEQSPINLRYNQAKYSEKMEMNGYGYKNFILKKEEIEMPNYLLKLEEGEYTLDLANG